MTPRDFAEYAALWREQIDPKELAELQAMATNIKRTARRRWLLDHLLGIQTAVAFCLMALLYPAPLLIKLCLLLIAVWPIWHMWSRRQISMAARAIAIDDPKVFFDAAIENMRAEINFFNMSHYVGVPFLIAYCLLLGAADGGFDHLFKVLREIFSLTSVKSIVIVVIFILGSIYYIRDHIRLREQLRRLEAMRREWDEREPGEEP